MMSNRQEERLHLVQTKPADQREEEKVYGGARPKVHSQGDIKQQRQMAKKSLSGSLGHLESVKEIDTKEEDYPMKESYQLPTEDKDEPEESFRDRCGQFFGVRSYLHTFYGSVTSRYQKDYTDIEDGDYRFLIKPWKKRRSALCRKICLWLGVNFLVFGMVLLLVGYLATRRKEIVEYQDEMEVIDRTAHTFNQNLHLCKVIGLIVFCAGGVIVTLIIVCSTAMNQYWEDDSGNHEVFKIATGDPEPPRTPTDRKVPATEELTVVQPRRSDEEEVVMTNTGLIKVP